MTHEEAVREWVARRARVRESLYAEPRRALRDEIRDVRFGIEEGWVGTDVTPGDPDFAAVRFELLERGEWVVKRIGLEGVTPATIVAECLAIFEEEVAVSPTTAEVDHAIRRVQDAHWGGSLKPVTPSVKLQVFVRFLRDARTLAAEVRRLRTVAATLDGRPDRKGARR